MVNQYHGDGGQGRPGPEYMGTDVNGGRDALLEWARQGKSTHSNGLSDDSKRWNGNVESAPQSYEHFGDSARYGDQTHPHGVAWNNTLFNRSNLTRATVLRH